MTIEELTDLLQNGKYRELLPHAERERKARPDNPAFAVLAAACLNGLKKYSKARNLARSELKRFPSNAHLTFELARAYLFLHEPEDAEHAFQRAIGLIGTTDDKFKSECLTNLGMAQWGARKREYALQSWREAYALDPTSSLAHDLLEEHLNQYGEPKAPTPVLDDIYHFYAIQKERYFELRGSQSKGFESPEEFEHVHAAMSKAWNEQIAPAKDRMDGMSPAEKTELFSKVQIDFTKEISPREMTRPVSSAETDLIQGVNEGYEPTNEQMMDLMNIFFGLPLLTLVGFSRERADEIIAGSTPSPIEDEVLEWAADVVAAVCDATEFAGTDNEVDAMMDAVAYACERLAPEEAPDAVRQVRLLIELFMEKVAETETMNKRKKKRKKR